MRLPLECFISCTTKCNLKCIHCYSNSGLLGKNINFDVAANFVNKMKPLRIVLSGGEPFLIIDELIQFFEKLEYKPYVVIATNGVIIDDFKLKKNTEIYR